MIVNILFNYLFSIIEQLKLKYKGSIYDNPRPGCSTDIIYDNRLPDSNTENRFTELLESQDIQTISIDSFNDYPFLKDFILSVNEGNFCYIMFC